MCQNIWITNMLKWMWGRIILKHVRMYSVITALENVHSHYFCMCIHTDHYYYQALTSLYEEVEKKRGKAEA